MDMKLIWLGCKNFKSLKSFEYDFDGENVVIKAENKRGKTTIYDAFLWLFFDKDSEGRKELGIRPLDKDNQLIKSLVLSVGAKIEIDGVIRSFRKEHHERVVKKQIRGYKSLHWIDDIPKTAKLYNEYIAKIIPEDTFKLLTDLAHFNTDKKMHWKKRRAVLLDIAGKISKPDGFADLMAAMKGHTIDDYKKALTEQKMQHEKDREEKTPRIDEIQRGLDSYVGGDDSQIEADRSRLKSEIAGLDNKRLDIIQAENKRQAAIEALNNLKLERTSHEGLLKNDTGSIQKYIDEKAKIETKVAEFQSKAVEIKSTISLNQSRLDNRQAELERRMVTLGSVRVEFTALQKPAEDAVCGLCGQALPANKLKEAESRREYMLQEAIKKGDAAKKLVDTCRIELEQRQDQANELQDELKKANIRWKEGDKYASERIPMLNGFIKSRPAPDFKQDKTWQQITEVIEAAEIEIGEPVPDQLTAIETERQVKDAELEAVNAALKNTDNRKDAAVRITELEAEKKKLSQLIADCDKQLDQVGQFIAAESRMIESAVNVKFKHVKFKLFNKLLNGEVEPCCETTLDGIPYPIQSKGEKIFSGLDGSVVLSKHYNMSVPLFIDNAESMTLPIEATCQTIELYAEKGTKMLTIEKKGKSNG